MGDGSPEALVNLGDVNASNTDDDETQHAKLMFRKKKNQWVFGGWISEEEDKRRRERDYEVMRTYKGSPEYQAYQRRQELKRFLAEAPSMQEEQVIELLTSTDFSQLPDELKEALANRMLRLEANKDQVDKGLQGANLR